MGEDLDPDEVTALLGCPPTIAQRKGDPWSARHPQRQRTQGAWKLETALAREAEVEAHITHLLDQVSTDPAVWQQINTRYFSRIFCGIFMERWNEGFGLTPAVLGRLSACGLHLDFDIYRPIDDEPGETSQHDAHEPTTD